MERKLRKVLLVLVIMGLTAASATAVMAQQLHAVNPYNYAAGIHEIGLYTMIVPGTVGYGRLWPLPGLTPGEPKHGGDGMSAESAGTVGEMTTPTAPQMTIGATAQRSSAMPMARANAGISKGAGPIDSSMGGFISGSSEEGRVDHLENGLRDLIHKLDTN